MRRCIVKVTDSLAQKVRKILAGCMWAQGVKSLRPTGLPWEPIHDRANYAMSVTHKYCLKYLVPRSAEREKDEA